MLKKITLVLLVSLLSVSILSACGKKEPSTVRIGEVTRSLFYAPLYVAIEEGIFEKHGLKIDLTTTPGGDKTMTALLSNTIDVALVGSETSIYVYQQGTEDPVINFAQLTQTDGTFLVSREKIDNFSFDMLKNTSFLGQRKGGMPQMAGEFALNKNGIKPHEDLELIQNIEFANIAPGFSSGIGDFVQLFEPTASIFEKEGTGYVVASFGVESGLLPYTVFMTKQSYMNKNDAQVQAFTDAIYEAQKWVVDHSASEIADAVTPYFDTVDREIMISSIERYKNQSSYALNPIIDEQEWNNLLNIIEGAGELTERVPHSTLVNNKYADQAIK